MKLVQDLCVVSHCAFLKITTARTYHENGAWLCQIGSLSLWPALSKMYVEQNVL